MAKHPKSSHKVVIDRRAKSNDRRDAADRRSKPATVTIERRQLQRREKVSRRRQIDPTTCERDYTEPELEFMQALETYKRTSGRMFPTCSELLEVFTKLGYQKSPAGADAGTTNGTSGEPIAS